MVEAERVMAEPPLTGVRVLELAAIGPVPLAGMLLADLGADVVRIDRVTRGELDVIPDGAADPVLRGRRIVRADLTDQAARDRVLRLVEHADVLIEGMRPGVAERLGVGPDRCCAANPGLVYGRMTGWGQNGPDAHDGGPRHQLPLSHRRFARHRTSGRAATGAAQPDRRLRRRVARSW